MNSTVSAEVAAFIEGQVFLAILDYSTTAIAVIMMWHYLLTLDKEVAYFWRRRPTGACAFFLANRYLTLIYAIYGTPWWSLSTTYTGCISAVVFQFVLRFSPYVVWAVFAGLRVYALHRHWWWATLVFLLSLVPIAVNGMYFRFIQIEFSSVTGCNLLSGRFDPRVTPRRGLDRRRRDTVGHTRAPPREFPPRTNVDYERTVQIRRDPFPPAPTIYNTLRLVTTLLPKSITRGTVAMILVSTFANFSDPLIGILMTHFLVALQEATSGAPVEGYDSGSALSVGTLRFVRADVDNWVRAECASLPTMGDGPGEESGRWGEECIDALECVQRKHGPFEDYTPEDAGEGQV